MNRPNVYAGRPLVTVGIDVWSGQLSLTGPPIHPHIKKSSFSIRTDFTLGIYQPEGQLITFGQLFQRRCIAYVIYLVIITKGKGPNHANRPAKLSILRYDK